MTVPRTLRVHRGFTLIEVLVTLFVIGILIALYGVGVMTLSLSREAAHRDVALHAANAEIENLRSSGYDALPTSGTFTNTLVASLPSGTGSTTITAYNDETKQVVVEVRWVEAGTRAGSVSLTTLITQIGGLP